jgi:hypothetical protein
VFLNGFESFEQFGPFELWLWLPAPIDSDFESQMDGENDRGSLPVRLSFHECNSLNSRAF